MRKLELEQNTHVSLKNVSNSNHMKITTQKVKPAHTYLQSLDMKSRTAVPNQTSRYQLNREIY